MGVRRLEERPPASELEPTVSAVVVALCADYARRARIIEARCASRRVDAEYRYYNFNMYDGAAEVVGEELAELYIREIGERRGYARTEHEEVSEATYKNNKLVVKQAIARRLHLTE